MKKLEYTSLTEPTSFNDAIEPRAWISATQALRFACRKRACSASQPELHVP
jgi:hypothetical protein